MEIRVETPPGNNIEQTNNVVDQINEVLVENESIIDVSFISVGGGGFGMGAGGNSASYTIQLIPASERDISTAEFVQQLDHDLRTIAGAEIVVSEMEAGMGMGDPIQIQLNGPEHDVLRDLSDMVTEEIQSIDGVFNPESGAGLGVPQLTVEVDHGIAASYGLTVEAVQIQIEMNFIGQLITLYREAGREIDVTLMYPEESNQTIADLEDMKIMTSSGASFPLSELATFTERQGPVSLTRQNQQAQVNVTSDISGRDLNSVVKDVEAHLEKMTFPEGYSYSIGGEAEDMQEAFGDLTLALIFSIFLVYAVMAVQFENFLFPFIIMFSMPATIVGVVGGLLVSGIAFSIPAFIGIIMLAGIVVNNSIVLVDYIIIL